MAPILHLVAALKEAGHLLGFGCTGRRGRLFIRGQVRGQLLGPQPLPGAGDKLIAREARLGSCWGLTKMANRLFRARRCSRRPEKALRAARRWIRLRCLMQPWILDFGAIIQFVRKRRGEGGGKASAMLRLQSGCPRLPRVLHAAPTELERGFVRPACYKYVAPTGASPSGRRALEGPCKEQALPAHSIPILTSMKPKRPRKRQAGGLAMQPTPCATISCTQPNSIWLAKRNWIN